MIRRTRSGKIRLSCSRTACHGSSLAERIAAMSPAAVVTPVRRRPRPRRLLRLRHLRLRRQQVRPCSHLAMGVTGRRRPLRRPRIRHLRQRRRPMTAAALAEAIPNLRPRLGLIPAEMTPARKRLSARAGSRTRSSAGVPADVGARRIRRGDSWTIAACIAETEKFLEADAKRIPRTGTRRPATGGASIRSGAISLHRARALHRLRRLGTLGLDGQQLPIARGTQERLSERHTPRHVKPSGRRHLGGMPVSGALTRRRLPHLGLQRLLRSHFRRPRPRQ